jgi:hypothetical protein
MRTPAFTCASCDATVVDSPVFHLGLAFCCAGCAADGPCMCSYDAPGAEVARTSRTIAVAGDVDAETSITDASVPVAVVEPPALASPTIAARTAPSTVLPAARPVQAPSAPGRGSIAEERLVAARDA